VLKLGERSEVYVLTGKGGKYTTVTRYIPVHTLYNSLTSGRMPTFQFTISPQPQNMVMRSLKMNTDTYDDSRKQYQNY